MTEQERYKRAVSALHPDPAFRVVLQKQGKTPARVRASLRFHAGLAAILWILALSLAGAGVYAADIGGIQRKIQILQHGELTDAVLSVSDTDGTYQVTTPSGKVLESGGGVSIGADGTERPLSREELLSDLADQVTNEVENGHYYLCWRSQLLDLTGAFDESGVCYVTVTDGTDTLYVTALISGALATSPYRYLIPGVDFFCSE